MRTKVAAVTCLLLVFALSGVAFADQAGHGTAAQTASGAKHLLGFALAFGLALAAFGGAFGQSRAIAAAVDAVARQPEAGGRIQGMMIIGLALIETLVIYMLLICFMWGGQLAS